MVTDELKKNKKDAAFAASFLFDSAVLSVELKAAAGAAANVACATARRVPATGVAAPRGSPGYPAAVPHGGLPVADLL
ncbi:hypothetical protein, partial [Stenotrophomonas maltophilia]|uniref:hypothetical protein n=1 Tax=Stenotrophomonas maltophilia TaxID=40324 RepID=UPI00209B9D32